MIKLSELKDDEMLLVNKLGYTLVLPKEDYVREMKEHEGYKIYTANQYRASLNAKDMIEDAIDYEYQNMYEDWDNEIIDDVTEKDIKDIQIILDRILSRSNNITYTEKEEVENDM